MDDLVRLRGGGSLLYMDAVWTTVMSPPPPACVKIKRRKVVNMITPCRLWSFYFVWALQEAARPLLRQNSDSSFKVCKSWHRCPLMSSVN